jgi:hypothetical protein
MAKPLRHGDGCGGERRTLYVRGRTANLRATWITVGVVCVSCGAWWPPTDDAGEPVGLADAVEAAERRL